jgi:hypothetical protein
VEKELAEVEEKAVEVEERVAEEVLADVVK